MSAGAPAGHRHMWREGAKLFLLMALCATPLLRALPPARQKIAPQTDLDGYGKLLGISRDPSLAGALKWFAGDDPQGVHTFRPLPALTLWFDFRLWGFRRLPYIVVNWLWIVATGCVIVLLSQTLGLPHTLSVAVGAFTMLASPSSSSDSGNIVYTIVGGAALRHDIVCVFFALVATWQLLLYWQHGRRCHLWAMSGGLLMALLSKEMALALFPFFLLLGIGGWKRVEHRKRILAAAASTLAIGILWTGWYAVALRSMSGETHPSHSIGGWWLLMRERWPTPLVMFIFSLSRPAGRLVFLSRSHLGWDALFYPVMWGAVIGLCIFITGLVLLWRRHPWLVWVLYAWKVTAYLPVLPMSDTWPWYEYMPHILDRIYTVGVLACVYEIPAVRAQLQAVVDPLVARLAARCHRRDE